MTEGLSMAVRENLAFIWDDIVVKNEMAESCTILSVEKPVIESRVVILFRKNYEYLECLL